MTRLVGCLVLGLALLPAGALAPHAGEGDTSRPPLPDAARTMAEILTALEAVPGRVVRLEVKGRAAWVRLEVEEQGAFDEARAALEKCAYLREAARDPTRVVEVGAAKTQGGQWQRDFGMRFRKGWGPPTPPRTKAHIAHADMEAFAVAAGLRPVLASRERVTPSHEAGAEFVTQRFEYEEMRGEADALTLERLRRLCRAITESGTYRVTELSWTRAPSTPEVPDPGDRIRKPQIEVAAWQPLPRAAPEPDTSAAAPPGPDIGLRDAYGVMRRAQGALHGQRARVVSLSVWGRTLQVRLHAPRREDLEAAYRAIEAHPFFRGAAEAERGSRVGRFVPMDGYVQLDFVLILVPGAWHGAPPLPADGIGRDFVQRACVVAGTEVVHTSAESRSRSPGGEIEVVRLHVDLAPRDGRTLTLAQLEAFLAFVDASDRYVVTGVTWARAPGGAAPADPGTAILRPRVEIASWIPKEG